VSPSPVVGHAIVRVRVVSSNLPGDIRDEVRRAARGADGDAAAAGGRIGERIEQSFARRFRGGVERVLRGDINRSRGGIGRLFSSFGGDLGRDLAGQFRLGIGAGRPGPAIVSMITLAGPSALGAAAALGVAAAGALTAALSSTLLAGGLLAAAFASGSKALDAGKEQWEAVGRSIGERVAEGMGAGFAAGGRVINERVIPAITPALTAIGEAFGNMFENLGKTLAIPENISRLGRILETNRRFIERFDVGLQGLTSAMLTLWAASQPMIDLVADVFAEFGQWAASALATAEANGTLATVMSNLTRLARAMFGWLARIGPAFGNWLLNLDVEGIIAGWESFGRIMGDIFDILGQIADGAGPHFREIMDNIHTILSNMVESGIIETIANKVGELLAAFTGFVATLSENPIAAKLLGIGLALLLFGGFLSPIFTLLKAVGGAFVALSSVLGTALLPVLAVVGVFTLLWSASEKFREAIIDLVKELAGTFSDIWDKLWPRIQSTWDAIWRLAELIGNVLAPVIRLLTPVLEFLAHIIGAVLLVVIEVIGLLANWLYGFLTGDWGPFIEQVQRLWNEFTAFLQEKWDEFIIWFQGKWEEFVVWIGGIWDGLTMVISLWWTALMSWFSSVWGGLLAAFHVWWDPIAAWWGALWTTIGNIVQAAATVIHVIVVSIAVAVGTAFGILAGVVVGIWNNLWNTVETVITTARAIISGIIGGLAALLVVIWNTLWATVERIVVGARNTISGIIGGLATVLVMVWNGLWRAVETIVTAARNYVVGVVQGLAAAIGVAWSLLSSTVISAWNTLWNTVENIISGARNTIATIVAGIANAVSVGWAWLGSHVSIIWNGIKNAIVQPIIDAYNAVTGWISNITSAVSGLLSKLGGWVSEANDKLNQTIAASAEAGTVTANMFNPDALPPSAQLARGGIVLATPGGINAVVGEGRNNERIEPLDSAGLSRRDRALISHIVNTMTSNGGGGSAPVTVQVMVGDHELTNFITRVVDSREDSLARRIAQRKGPG
jgi:phage-related protein